MTVEENIFLPVRIRQHSARTRGPAWRNTGAGWRSASWRRTRRHYPYQLSGGMKQKIALIRGFLTEPDFVMMDEPFKSIDLRSKQAIIRHILASLSGYHGVVRHAYH